MATAQTSRSAREIIETSIAAWNKKDMETFLADFADDCVFEDHGMGGIFKGRAAIEKYLLGWSSAVPDMRITLHDLLVNGDTMAVGHYSLTGTQRGDLPGMPASGKTISMHGMYLIECTNGKIHRQVEFYDVVDLLHQLDGPLPPKP